MYDYDFDLGANLAPVLVDGVLKREWSREHAVTLAAEYMMNGMLSERQLKYVMTYTKPGAEQPQG